MKKELLIASLVAGLTGFAHAEPAPDLAAAAKKLSAAKNYTWTSSSAFGDREPRVTSGKVGSGGHTLINYPIRDSSIEVLIRNGKAAIKTDDGWQVADAEAEGDENRRLRYLARIAERYEAPTVRVTELIAKIGELKVEEGRYSATLSEEAAKEMMSFRGRGRGPDGGQREAPQISGASGSVKILVKDGILTKYELTLNGKMTINNQERDISRTSTVEFKDVDSTKFEIAEEAAGLLSKSSDS
ncbi:MAG: hypothetical protein ABGZ37_06970 [Akkermansiaceae bacterium]